MHFKKEALLNQRMNFISRKAVGTPPLASRGLQGADAGSAHSPSSKDASRPSKGAKNSCLLILKNVNSYIKSATLKKTLVSLSY
jgi:hypothetical protein